MRSEGVAGEDLSIGAEAYIAADGTFRRFEHPATFRVVENIKAGARVRSHAMFDTAIMNADSDDNEVLNRYPR